MTSGTSGQRFKAKKKPRDETAQNRSRMGRGAASAKTPSKRPASQAAARYISSKRNARV